MAGLMEKIGSPEFLQWVGGLGAGLSRAGRGGPFDISDANTLYFQQQKARKARERLGGLMEQMQLTPQQRGFVESLPVEAQQSVIGRQLFPNDRELTEFERILSMLPPEQIAQAVRIKAGLEPKAGDDSEATAAMREAAWAYPDDPEAQRQYVVTKGTTPLVSMGEGETSYQKEMGKFDAKSYVDIVDRGRQANARLESLNAMETLLAQPGVYTGTGGEWVGDLKGLAQSMGMETWAEGVGPTQALEAFGNQMTLQMRNAAEGAGMPGQMSDADRAFLKKTVPSLSKTPEGNRILIAIMKRMQLRQVDAMREAMKMRQEGIRFSEAELNARMGKKYGELFSAEEWGQLFAGLPTDVLRSIAGGG